VDARPAWQLAPAEMKREAAAALSADACAAATPKRRIVGQGQARSSRKRQEEVSAAQLDKVRAKLRAAAYTAHGPDYSALFARFDDDGSGALSVAELRTHLKKIALLSALETRALCTAFDEDGDGMVDSDEFRRFCTKESLTGAGLSPRARVRRESLVQLSLANNNEEIPPPPPPPPPLLTTAAAAAAAAEIASNDAPPPPPSLPHPEDEGARGKHHDQLRWQDAAAASLPAAGIRSPAMSARQAPPPRSHRRAIGTKGMGGGVGGAGESGPGEVPRPILREHSPPPPPPPGPPPAFGHGAFQVRLRACANTAPLRARARSCAA
jgi:hypothetical protein